MNVWIGTSVPLGHVRRCVRHDGHGSGNPIGLAIIYTLLKGGLSVSN